MSFNGSPTARMPPNMANDDSFSPPDSPFSRFHKSTLINSHSLPSSQMSKGVEGGGGGGDNIPAKLLRGSFKRTVMSGGSSSNNNNNNNAGVDVNSHLFAHEIFASTAIASFQNSTPEDRTCSPGNDRHNDNFNTDHSMTASMSYADAMTAIGRRCFFEQPQQLVGATIDNSTTGIVPGHLEQQQQQRQQLQFVDKSRSYISNLGYPDSNNNNNVIDSSNINGNNYIISLLEPSGTHPASFFLGNNQPALPVSRECSLNNNINIHRPSPVEFPVMKKKDTSDPHSSSSFPAAQVSTGTLVVDNSGQYPVLPNLNSKSVVVPAPVTFLTSNVPDLRIMPPTLTNAATNTAAINPYNDGDMKIMDAAGLNLPVIGINPDPFSSAVASSNRADHLFEEALILNLTMEQTKDSQMNHHHGVSPTMIQTAAVTSTAGLSPSSFANTTATVATATAFGSNSLHLSCSSNSSTQENNNNPMSTPAAAAAAAAALHTSDRAALLANVQSIRTPDQVMGLFTVLGSTMRSKADPFIDATCWEDPGVRRRARGGVCELFPDRLYRMIIDLEMQGTDDIIGFLPHGRAFCVHKMDQFLNDILPRYFSDQTKWSSFSRQLNLYGFLRATSGRDAGAYYHELFLKGRPNLVAYMRRVGAPKGVGTVDRRRWKPPEGDDPDLWSLKPIT